MSTKENTNEDPKWALTTRYIVGVGLVLAGIALFFAIRSELSVVVLAALITYLVQPVVDGLRGRLGLSRGLAVLFTYLGVLFVIFLILALVIPAMVNTVQSFAAVDWTGAAENVKTWLENTLTDLQDIDFGIAALNDQVDSLVQPLLDTLAGAGPVEAPETTDASTIISSIGDALSASVDAIASVAGGLIAALVSFALMMIFSIYMSLESPKFRPGFIKTVPVRYRGEANELIDRLALIWRGYLHGELRLMFIIGSIVAVGNLLLGTPAALFLGIISGLMEVVPGIGPALALIPAVTVALVGGSSHLPVSNLMFALIVLIFYEGVQVFENNVILPRVMTRCKSLLPVCSGTVGPLSWIAKWNFLMRHGDW